jgi:hypothetical protein
MARSDHGHVPIMSAFFKKPMNLVAFLKRHSAVPPVLNVKPTRVREIWRYMPRYHLWFRPAFRASQTLNGVFERRGQQPGTGVGDNLVSVFFTHGKMGVGASVLVKEEVAEGRVMDG